MASPSSLMESLWSQEEEALRVAVFAGDLGDLTVSSLLKSYLDLLHEHRVHDDFAELKPRSLRSSALEGIVKWLNTSPDILNSAQEITSGLNDLILRDLLSAPSLRYPVLRACIGAVKAGDCQSMVDIDEIVLTNERYLRSRMDQISDDSHLLSLEDFCTILSISSDDKGFGMLHRPSLPDGGVEFRNPKHEKSLLVHTSSAEVAAGLMQDFGKELRGLDWGNILMIGDPVTRVVMNRQNTPNQAGSSMWYVPIELYLYGLSVEEANQKVGHIHDVWVSNFSAAGDERMVVKDGANISLISSTRIRPIRIKSKLFRNKTEALLNLGPGAIGFDGFRVVMLPRYARALETGYLTLTMDYAWSCALGEAEAKMRRLSQHADHGFGRRFLPSYVRSIQGTALILPSIPDLLKDPHLAYLQGREFFVQDLPEVYWDGHSFDLPRLARVIDETNDAAFSDLQEAICNRLQVPLQRSGWSNYLTRRIRRCVYGSDFNAVQEKQITIPMVVPADLETHICASVLPHMSLDYQPLIPVHDPSKHDPQIARLPSLPISGHDMGNLRYWIVSNKSMWAGQPALDDLSRVLRCLDNWFQAPAAFMAGSWADTSSRECVYKTMLYLRQQTGPMFLGNDIVSHARRKEGLPPMIEALLFRALCFGEYPFKRDAEESDEHASNPIDDEDAT